MVLQSTVGNGLSFDHLSFGQDCRAAPAIDVCGGEIVDALMVSAVVVVVDESRNLSFEIARQKVIFQQDAVFEGLMPALDFALGHRMIRRAAKVFDIAVVEPFGQVARDIAGTIVGQQPWAIGWLGLIKAAGPQCQVEGVGNIFRTHAGAQFPRHNVAREVVEYG